MRWNTKIPINKNYQFIQGFPHQLLCIFPKHNNTSGNVFWYLGSGYGSTNKGNDQMFCRFIKVTKAKGSNSTVFIWNVGKSVG